MWNFNLSQVFAETYLANIYPNICIDLTLSDIPVWRYENWVLSQPHFFIFGIELYRICGIELCIFEVHVEFHVRQSIMFCEIL